MYQEYADDLRAIRNMLERLVEQTKKPEPAKTMEKQIKRFAVAKAVEGYELTMATLHPEDWQDLADSLETRGVRGGNDEHGRACICLSTVVGPVPVYAGAAMELGTMHTSCKERAR